MKKRKTMNRYRISDKSCEKTETLQAGPKKGVKRSLLTEATGVPIGLAVDGAGRLRELTESAFGKG